VAWGTLDQLLSYPHPYSYIQALVTSSAIEHWRYARYCVKHSTGIVFLSPERQVSLSHCTDKKTETGVKMRRGPQAEGSQG
jgi:hypothetical protein